MGHIHLPTDPPVSTCLSRHSIIRETDVCFYDPCRGQQQWPESLWMMGGPSRLQDLLTDASCTEASPQHLSAPSVPLSLLITVPYILSDTKI